MLHFLAVLRKDVRYAAPFLIGCWLGPIAAMMFAASNPLWVTLLLGNGPAALTIMFVVQMDHPFDPEGFPACRPIPWHTNLASKLCLFFLAAHVPRTAVLCIWALATNPQGFWQQAAIGFQSSHFMLLFALPALFSRKVVLGYLWAVLGFILIGLLYDYLVFDWAAILTWTEAYPDGRMHDFFLILEAGTLLVLVLGFYTRNWWEPAFLATLFLITALGWSRYGVVPQHTVIPRNADRAITRDEAVNRFLTRPLELENRPLALKRDDLDKNKRTVNLMTIVRPARIKDLPPDTYLVQQSYRVTAGFPDGVEQTQRRLIHINDVRPMKPHGPILSYPILSDNLSFKEEMSDLPTWVEYYRAENGNPLPESMKGTMVFRLERFRTRYVPLQPGAVLWHKHGFCRVVSVNVDEDSYNQKMGTVLLEEVSSYATWGPESLPFTIIHPRTGRAISPKEKENKDKTLRKGVRTFQFYSYYEDALPVTEWIREGRLALFYSEPLGYKTMDFQIQLDPESLKLLRY